MTALSALHLPAGLYRTSRWHRSGDCRTGAVSCGSRRPTTRH